ncbi:MAG: hypothetical protein ACE5O2_08445 [Armatimonadota bacterium]
MRGERIGHLSRYDRIDLLQEEMAAFAADVQPQQARYHFRKAFFGAGGKQEHWERFAEPLLSRPAFASTSAAGPSGTPVSPPARPVAPPPQPASPPAPPEAKPETPEVAAQAHPDSEEPTLPTEVVSDRIIVVRPQSVFGSGEAGGTALLGIVSRHISEGGRGALLDLSATDKLRADATGPLLACHLKLQAVGGELAVLVTSEPARTLLDATGISRRTPCFDNRDDALKHLEQVCAPPPVSATS